MVDAGLMPLDYIRGLCGSVTARLISACQRLCSGAPLDL